MRYDKLWGLLVLLGACGTPAGPLEILSVEPQQMATNESGELALKLSGVLPVSVDYTRQQAPDFPDVTVLIGEQELGAARHDGTGRFVVAVAEGLPVGEHDVKARLADGREAILPLGFKVTDKAPLTHFRVDVHGDPLFVNTLIPITLYAQGAEAWRYTGRVRLSVNKGTVTPAESTAFAAGVRTLEIKLDTPGTDIILTVEDPTTGRKGQSRALTLVPKS